MKFFKTLNQNGMDDNGVWWSLPVRKSDDTWVAGDWMTPVEGELEMVGMEDHGYRVYDVDDIVFELAPRVFEVEVRDEIVDHPIHGYLVRTCRLTRELESWNEPTARLFACDNAEKVLPIYEKAHPGDDRPRKAIEVARNFAKAQANASDLPSAFVLNAKNTLTWAAEAARAAAMESHLSCDLASKYAALAAASAAAVSGHIAYHAFDAAYATRRAIYESTFDEVIKAEAELGLADDEEAKERAINAADSEEEYILKWQVEQIKKILEIDE